MKCNWNRNSTERGIKTTGHLWSHGDTRCYFPSFELSSGTAVPSRRKSAFQLTAFPKEPLENMKYSERGEICSPLFLLTSLFRIAKRLRWQSVPGSRPRQRRGCSGPAELLTPASALWSPIQSSRLPDAYHIFKGEKRCWRSPTRPWEKESQGHKLWVRHKENPIPRMKSICIG